LTFTKLNSKYRKYIRSKVLVSAFQVFQGILTSAGPFHLQRDAAAEIISVPLPQKERYIVSLTLENNAGNLRDRSREKLSFFPKVRKFSRRQSRRNLQIRA